MVSQQPGTYFRSELSPTQEMLFGLVENAAGWHFHDEHRKEIIKGLAKQAKKKHGKDPVWKDHPWMKGKLDTSGCGYASLLQFHLSFSKKEADYSPLAWDDLWSMLNKNDSISFVGGSRNYDFRLENLITSSRKENPTVTFGDRTGFSHFTLDELRELAEGQVHVKSLSPNFPQFYSSPRKRGYIEPTEPWVYEVACTQKVAEIIFESMNQPAAPLYLGTNDGWVHAKWESND
jgi:CRISPR-associated protein Cas5